MRNLWHVQHLRTIDYALRRPVTSFRSLCQPPGSRRYSRYSWNLNLSRASLAYTHPRELLARERVGTGLFRGYSTTAEEAQDASHGTPSIPETLPAKRSSRGKRRRGDKKSAPSSKWKKATNHLDKSLGPEHAKGLIPKHLVKDYKRLGNLMENPKAFTMRIEDEEAVKVTSNIVAKGVQHYQCEVECKIVDSDVTISTVGEGESKARAIRAAYLFLISELHTRDLLKPLVEIVIGGPLLDNKTLEREGDAQTDVFNYAARFGYVPKTTVRQFTKHIRGQEKHRVEVMMELPEQNIKAVATSKTFELSQIAAAMMFKQQAEKYHSDSELSTSTINNTLSLTTQNAGEFTKFYKFYHQRTKFGLEIDSVESLAEKQSFFEAAITADGNPITTPIAHRSKKGAESLALLAAAVTLQQQEPQLQSGFLEALRAGNGKILVPLAPVELSMDEDCLLVMRDTLQELREAGFPDDSENYQPDLAPVDVQRQQSRRYLNDKRSAKRSEALSSLRNQFKEDPKLEDLRAKLEALPMSQYRDKVLDMVQNNTYSVVVGATGSGKTTQVPQILLDDAIERGNGAGCNIICTQPRRIAATSVARRVADERGQPLQNSVGYHVRFDAKLPEIGGSITYCTTGILLVQLQHAADEIFDYVSHLVIDEVHERDVDVDFLLIVLKNTVKERRKAGKSVPKIVLMSATLDIDLFADFFKNESSDGTLTRCPTLSVPGRTFPVQEWYLEDLLQTFSTNNKPEDLAPFFAEKNTAEYLDKIEMGSQSGYGNKIVGRKDIDVGERPSINWGEMETSSLGSEEPTDIREDPVVPIGLVCATVAHIAKTTEDGAILVFLPGLDEITKTEMMLLEASPLGVKISDSDKYRIFKLHSSIPSGQTDVFEPLPTGCRKIILATNIAETSITIPEVQYIVDSGKLREKIYDPARRISKLACCWINKSNAKQRAGRAGRVQNGNYYALYTREQLSSLRAAGVPEMLRIDLQEVCLRVKTQAFKAPIREFLAQAMEPPLPDRVDASVRSLKDLQALDQDEEITALGRLLAELPVHPSLGKMIVLGIIFRCLEPMIIIGACQSARSLWFHPQPSDRRPAAVSRKDFVEDSNSEHIAMINAFREVYRVWNKSGHHAAYHHANSKYISFVAFRNIMRSAQQIEDILRQSQLIPRGSRAFSPRQEFGGPELNVNSGSTPIIKALLTSGMFPNLAVRSGRDAGWRTQGEAVTTLHPRSINGNKTISGTRKFEPGTVMLFSSMDGSSMGNNLFLRESGEITPLMAFLFGGRLTGTGKFLTMDSWLPFIIKPTNASAYSYSPAKTVIEFRKALDRVLSIAFRDLNKFKLSHGDRFGRTPRPREYLADDPVRAMFSERFVEVFDRDVNKEEGSRAARPRLALR